MRHIANCSTSMALLAGARTAAARLFLRRPRRCPTTSAASPVCLASRLVARHLPAPRSRRPALRTAWGTLLVTQLPEHIRKHYPGQVRVYLPPFPYVLPPAPTRRRFTHYGLEEEPVLQCPRQFVSIIELQGPARELFFETVYGEGKGKTILRSPVWDGGRDLDAANNTVGDVKMEDAFDAPATADKDVPEVKMSCMYHMHTEDRACWLLKNPLVNGGVWPTEDEE
ncbi:uncharacterized protein CC84DRAFT_436437 [Paraphaeosphaeria sporulosa]|uniref:Uncharacterized protein n=1 Tax=Paraphaeosphaeria sporulosa TaxID=1460663 RepID=A0A177CQC2_9PLEO|nr:uncharacterized protein CC84DRAFT_436437 [Paraphaeosphaeria sporulosa]OAG09421.1 hypothetical protein CC84DRAFT_436437 [Paraphaeosphaeria sporulosa]